MNGLLPPPTQPFPPRRLPSHSFSPKTQPTFFPKPQAIPSSQNPTFLLPRTQLSFIPKPYLQRFLYLKRMILKCSLPSSPRWRSFCLRLSIFLR
ncbi:hypothetical protein FF1_012007 [Malus domestica]